MSISIHTVPIQPTNKLEQTILDKIPKKLSDLEMDIAIECSYDDTELKTEIDKKVDATFVNVAITNAITNELNADF